MIIAQLTDPALIKLLGKELLLLEKVDTEEETKYSVLDKLPPDLQEYCSYFFLSENEFSIISYLADVPPLGSLNIDNGLNVLDNYSNNIWEILNLLQDQLGDEKNYEASKLQKIRISTEQITDQAQRLLKVSSVLHQQLETMIHESQITQNAA